MIYIRIAKYVIYDIMQFFSHFITCSAYEEEVLIRPETIVVQLPVHPMMFLYNASTHILSTIARYAFHTSTINQ